jgi:diadenosine tetraphosphatase ApaH/serine/threonine PP2A family protein phosphatase
VKDKDRITFLDEPKIKISKDKNYIINVGSIGQPRDGDWRASFAIYDLDNRIVEIKRIEYNISQAQKKIIEAKLPIFLAIRLGVGR